MSYDKNLWNSIKAELKKDKTREGEMKNKAINCRNNQTLRFYEKVVKHLLQDLCFLYVCMEEDKVLRQ